MDRLLRAGRRVVVFDDLSTGRLANLATALQSEHVTFVYQDVSADVATLREALASATEEPLAEIFHLGSPASPEAYGRHPWETLAVNGIGTMSLIELALEQHASMLFASTSEVYGNPLTHPQPESYFGNVNPVGPRACYDEGKRFGEAAMSVAARSRGLRGRIVRLFNCYGPRMGLDDGRLIPELLAAVSEKRPFSLHGDGRQTRSMTYVADVVEGLLAVNAAAIGGDQPVNLGSEEERTVAEVAQAVATLAGVPFECTWLPGRPEDPQRRRPDLTFARSLGWEPRVALTDGLSRTLDWARTEAPSYA